MSVTLDANVLIYASNTSSPRRATARALLDRLAEGPGLVYVFWPVAMAYLRISTHPGIFVEPLAPAVARANLDDLLTRAHVRCPGELAGFWQGFSDLVADDPVRGNLVTDAHIAALMLQHGVETIWTSDRDFHRFAHVQVRDPYAEPSA